MSKATDLDDFLSRCDDVLTDWPGSVDAMHWSDEPELARSSEFDSYRQRWVGSSVVHSAPILWTGRGYICAECEDLADTYALDAPDYHFYVDARVADFVSVSRRKPLAVTIRPCGHEFTSVHGGWIVTGQL